MTCRPAVLTADVLLATVAAAPPASAQPPAGAIALTVSPNTPNAASAPGVAVDGSEVDRSRAKTTHEKARVKGTDGTSMAVPVTIPCRA